MTPSTLDRSLSSLSNTSPVFDHLVDDPSLRSPFAATGSHYLFPGEDTGPPSISPMPSPLIPSKRMADDIEDAEMGPDTSGFIPRQRKPMVQRKSSLLEVLRDLQDLRYTAIDLLLAIIDGEGEFAAYRTSLFSSRCCTSIVRLLDRLLEDKKGHPIVSDWMFPHALHLVCERIHTEMEEAKPHLRMSTGDVSPKFIEDWDIHQTMKPVVRDTPTLNTILVAAGESKASMSRTKTAKSKNRSTALLIIMAQIHFLRSRNSAMVQIGLGLQAWACGTSRQMIDVLHRTCLTVSYTSISNMVLALADRSIERAKDASLRPHALAYDNVNISSSIFVEQGPNTMSKVQSGTFAVIYELLNARAEDMDIKPLVENLRRSSPLVLADLRMKPEAGYSYISQTAITLVHILMKYVKGFEEQQTNVLLKHHQRRPMPVGHKTVFHPLRASTIEEASIDGNLLVHDDVYTVQLQRSSEDLDMFAIPTLNDQLTNARIRGGQNIRQKDVSPWERREIFQLGFGCFHMVMNLLWCVLETHRGTLNQVGSLTHLFAILEKARLGGEHPDYHTLLSALMQILHGFVLNAWLTECNHSSLADYAKAGPTPQNLLDCAHRIIGKYAVPISLDSIFEPSSSKVPLKDLRSGLGFQRPVTDIIRNNNALLTRDLLYVTELVNAMATGDFGRIEDILPNIACMFRGSGSNNYSMEILHLIFNIKEIWTPEFAYVLFFPVYLYLIR